MSRFAPLSFRDFITGSKALANPIPNSPGKYVTLNKPTPGATIAWERGFGSTIGGRDLVPFLVGTFADTWRMFSPLASAILKSHVCPTSKGGIVGGRYSVPFTASNISPGLRPAAWAG